jgi:hypothetical protein
VSSSSERRLTELLAALLPQDAALLSNSALELPAGEACFDHNTFFDNNAFFAQLAAQPPRELGHMLVHLYEDMYINTLSICYYIDLLYVLGHVLLYAQSLPSTQDLLFADLRDPPRGLVCVADRQTKGRGRGSNVWASPAGCL